MNAAWLVSDVYVGRTEDGTRVFITAEVKHCANGAPYETVHHRTVTEYRSLSIMGKTIAAGAVTPTSGGQLVDELRAVTRPAGPFTLADLAELADVWERWHLNGMRAACAHQTVTTDETLRRTAERCPFSGYVYGTAWLVEPLDGLDEAFVLAVLTQPGVRTLSDDPDRELPIVGMTTKPTVKRPKWANSATWDGTSWRVTLTFQGRRMGLDYFMGRALTDGPNVNDVLDALISDARDVDNGADPMGASFAEWAGALGLDVWGDPGEVRKHRAAYAGAVRQRERLAVLLGDAYSRFVGAS